MIFLNQINEHVEFYFSLNLTEPRFCANVDDVGLGVFRERSEEPIRMPVDIFVGRLKRGVVLGKSLHIPVWYKQYLHYALFRRSLSANICFTDAGQHTAIAINTRAKYTATNILL